ncbi:DUF4250 domain-containing protein [Chakrabartyella piscis]|uniref:DUF4250 domain-containing protein n=1 Tax=Chakrabartyella piscis TaxID=2918914 RepID=UPI002958CB34|nr:DUF4250 domain-containing protein [Chakrabartyella piscis]
MSNLPKDPVMLLSVINTKLRDTYSNLELLCQEEGVVVSELTAKLAAIDYVYDANSNQFK